MAKALTHSHRHNLRQIIFSTQASFQMGALVQPSKATLQNSQVDQHCNIQVEHRLNHHIDGENLINYICIYVCALVM